MPQLQSFSVIALAVVLTSCSGRDSLPEGQGGRETVASVHGQQEPDAHPGQKKHPNAHAQHDVADQHHAKHHNSADSTHGAKGGEHVNHGQHDHAAEHSSHHSNHESTETTSHATEELTALQLFKRRITPILQAKNPSSCSECHLSGVNLKQYIGPDQEATFASLRASGLVDMDNPDASKILTFINRQPQKPSLITDKIRKEEYAAFRAWLHAAVKDPKLAAVETSDTLLGPAVPDAVIRHARKDRVLASFIDNVWSEVGRCAACHSPDRNQKQVKEFGEQVSWIKLRDPQATLDYMLEAELFDLDTPEKSPLLMKPTLQAEHGGGQKLVVGDRTYKQFRRFVEDYSAVSKGTYRSADALPAASDEISQASDIWLKLTNVPARFDKKLLQVDLYRWNRDSNSWSEDRWATADRAIAGDRNLWQQHISITAPRESDRAARVRQEPRLQPGKYLVKIYIDQNDKLQMQYPTELTEEDFIGQVEIDGRWQAGYGRMTVAEFP